MKSGNCSERWQTSYEAQSQQHAGQSSPRPWRGAALRTNHAAVVQIDPAHRQGMVNWKTGSSIPPSRQVSAALHDYPYRWAICIGAFCEAQDGERYYKFSKVATAGIYLAAHLPDFIRTHYVELMDTCNPRHVVGSGWIATPYDVELTDPQAAFVFEACGAWNQQAAA